MKILVTGAKGQLGSDLVKQLDNRNITHFGADRHDFDITDNDKTCSFIKSYRPDLVVHCAGYTKVDDAEENITYCIKVNYEGTKNVALSCKEVGSKLIYISTDYIFDGMKNLPYEVNDNANPLNIYGWSKLLGENCVTEVLKNYFIIRVSWMFGHSDNNFVETIINLAKEKKKLNVVDDQIGSPTYTVDLADKIIEIGQSDKFGIYHVTNEGFCTRARFAEEIIKNLNLRCEINHIKCNEYASKALRPKNSKLSKKSLLESGFSLLPTWEDALKRYLETRGRYTGR